MMTRILPMLIFGILIGLAGSELSLAKSKQDSASDHSRCTVNIPGVPLCSQDSSASTTATRVTNSTRPIISALDQIKMRKLNSCFFQWPPRSNFTGLTFSQALKRRNISEQVLRQSYTQMIRCQDSCLSELDVLKLVEHFAARCPGFRCDMTQSGVQGIAEIQSSSPTVDTGVNPETVGCRSNGARTAN